MNEKLKGDLLRLLVAEGVEVSIYPNAHRVDEETHIVGKLEFIRATNCFSVQGKEHTGEYGQIEQPGLVIFTALAVTSMSVRLMGNKPISYVKPTSVSITVNVTGEPEWQVGDG